MWVSLASCSELNSFAQHFSLISSWQMVSLILESLSWCSMLVMIAVETKIYICEFRWFVRFGVIYTLVGDAVLLNLILSVKDFYSRFLSLCFTWIGSFLVKCWYDYLCFQIFLNILYFLVHFGDLWFCKMCSQYCVIH